MFRCLLWAFAAAMRPRLLLIADNLCLRQQLLVLQRRKPRPRLTDSDRRFRILVYRWFVSWQISSERQDGPPPNCARTAHPDPADDHGEPSFGASAGSRRSWRGWGSKSPRER